MSLAEGDGNDLNQDIWVNPKFAASFADSWTLQMQNESVGRFQEPEGFTTRTAQAWK